MNVTHKVQLWRWTRQAAKAGKDDGAASIPLPTATEAPPSLGRLLNLTRGLRDGVYKAWSTRDAELAKMLGLARQEQRELEGRLERELPLLASLEGEAAKAQAAFDEQASAISEALTALADSYESAKNRIANSSPDEWTVPEVPESAVDAPSQGRVQDLEKEIESLERARDQLEERAKEAKKGPSPWLALLAAVALLVVDTPFNASALGLFGLPTAATYGIAVVLAGVLLLFARYIGEYFKERNKKMAYGLSAVVILFLVLAAGLRLAYFDRIASQGTDLTPLIDALLQGSPSDAGTVATTAAQVPDFWRLVEFFGFLIISLIVITLGALLEFKYHESQSEITREKSKVKKKLTAARRERDELITEIKKADAEVRHGQRDRLAKEAETRRNERESQIQTWRNAQLETERVSFTQSREDLYERQRRLEGPRDEVLGELLRLRSAVSSLQAELADKSAEVVRLHESQRKLARMCRDTLTNLMPHCNNVALAYRQANERVQKIELPVLRDLGRETLPLPVEQWHRVQDTAEGVA